MGRGVQQTKAFRQLTPEIVDIRRRLRSCSTKAGRKCLRKELQCLMDSLPLPTTAANVVKIWRWGRKILSYFVANFSRTLRLSFCIRIGQVLPKLGPKNYGVLFVPHSVYGNSLWMGPNSEAHSVPSYLLTCQRSTSSFSSPPHFSSSKALWYTSPTTLPFVPLE